MIKAIKLIDYCFKFERALFRSSGRRGVDRLLVIGRRDTLVKGRPRYSESRYRESRVYLNQTNSGLIERNDCLKFNKSNFKNGIFYLNKTFLSNQNKTVKI